MSAPADIVNGDIPDATKLMAWFDWLAAGKGIRSDTYSNLKSSPGTDPFFAWATDIKVLFFYCADATAGDEGFITITGG